MMEILIVFSYSNTTLVKVKSILKILFSAITTNSNTTLVKVKWIVIMNGNIMQTNSNTTLVKVKLDVENPILPIKTFKYNTC